jgi:hypothetical protein
MVALAETPNFNEALQLNDPLGSCHSNSAHDAPAIFIFLFF